MNADKKKTGKKKGKRSWDRNLIQVQILIEPKYFFYYFLLASPTEDPVSGVLFFFLGIISTRTERGKRNI
jgi:hypothetical protein